MKKVFTLFFLSCVMQWGNSQDLAIEELSLRNPSSQINDGFARLSVKGGTPPYKYYWSNQSTDTISRISEGLTEGIGYSLKVVDSEGASAKTTFTIASESVAEKFNGTFVPIVNGVAAVIFWDPFYALNLYDNRVYNDAGELARFPNGTIRTNSIPFIVVWLIFGALFFTLRMGFINIRGVKHSLELVRGHFDESKAPGEVTHFQALATAVSATVGLGNIAGVAVAISLGGPGATFWLIIAGFLGMSSKFVECTLGVKYRDIDQDGVVSGGPMHYMRKGLERRNMKGLGKVLAGVFAFLVIGASFGGGNMFQANQAFEQLSGEFSVLEGKGPYFGIVLAVLVGAVIIGGIKSIAKVTEKIVPIMAGTYILAALIIIGMNISEIGHAFELIVKGAFEAEALRGGFIGVLIQGFRRAAFSNEAGIGSAAIAHSAAKTHHPVSEGFVALLEPFIDTVVVCTLTALVLIFTGFHAEESLSGAQLTSGAFGSVISWFPYVLVIAIFLFAFSTMISWSYYGLKGWTYLFGRSQRTELVYKVIFLLFVIVGASVSLGAVLDFSDMMILSMALPNIIGLLLLSGEVRKDLKDYFKKYKAGEILRVKKNK